MTGLDGQARVSGGRSRLPDRRHLIIFQSVRCNKALLIKHVLSSASIMLFPIVLFKRCVPLKIEINQKNVTKVSFNACLLMCS